MSRKFKYVRELMDSDKLLYIWRLPYSAPQEALGLFTLTEAARFLCTTPMLIVDAIANGGDCEGNNFHVEWDE